MALRTVKIEKTFLSHTVRKKAKCGAKQQVTRPFNLLKLAILFILSGFFLYILSFFFFFICLFVFIKFNDIFSSLTHIMAVRDASMCFLAFSHKYWHTFLSKALDYFFHIHQRQEPENRREERLSQLGIEPETPRSLRLHYQLCYPGGHFSTPKDNC